MEIRNDEHPKKVLVGLKAMRERSELTDVVLEVEGRSFPCHRAVLACSSPYFRTMFTSGYVEAKEGRIRIQDVREVAMATILDYAYTGSLKLEPDQVQAVMTAATLLQVDFVRHKAAKYIKDHLDVANCSDALMYADMLGDVTLQEASRRYMASRFNQVALQPSFLQLSLPQLQSLLDRDDLNTKSENDVVQAAQRWVEFDQEERQQHLPALCMSFRHSFIGSKHRRDLQSKCQTAASELVYSNSTTWRLGRTCTEMQVFLTTDYFSRVAFPWTIPCYDPLRDRMYRMKIPDNLNGFSMAVTADDELYLAGVIYSMRDGVVVDTTKAFFQYNHLLNSWEPRCEMITGRARCGLVYLKGYIYAIGGDDTNQTAERYDPNCDEWTSIEPIPSPNFFLSLHCTVTLGDSIYVISKEGCYIFSATENTWNKIADMLRPLQRPQAVTYMGCIYCLDSEGSSTRVQIYNPENGMWKDSGDDMSCEHASLMLYRMSLYLVAGRRENTSAISSRYWVEIYHYQPDIDSWVKEDSEVPDRIPLMGGRRGMGSLVAKLIPKCLVSQDIDIDGQCSNNTSSDLSESESSNDGDSEDDTSDDDDNYDQDGDI